MNNWVVVATERALSGVSYYYVILDNYVPASWRTILVRGLTVEEARALVALLNAGEQHEHPD